MRWVGDHRVPIGELEDTAARFEGRGELASRTRQGRNGVERRQGEEGEGRDEHAIERPRVVRRDREREHPDERQAGDQHQPAVGGTGHESITAPEAAELGVGGGDAGVGVVLPTVRCELGGASKDLRKLGRKLTPGGDLPAPDDARQPRGQQGHADSAER